MERHWTFLDLSRTNFVVARLRESNFSDAVSSWLPNYVVFHYKFRGGRTCQNRAKQNLQKSWQRSSQAVFAKRHIASERAPRASAVREFGFEPDRDLVAAVEGVPEPAYWPLLGTKVRGGVSFKFELEVLRLVETLDQIIERFDSNDHRLRWPSDN